MFQLPAPLRQYTWPIEWNEDFAEDSRWHRMLVAACVPCLYVGCWPCGCGCKHFYFILFAKMEWVKFEFRFSLLLFFSFVWMPNYEFLRSVSLHFSICVQLSWNAQMAERNRHTSYAVIVYISTLFVRAHVSCFIFVYCNVYPITLLPTVYGKIRCNCFVSRPVCKSFLRWIFHFTFK